MKKQKNKNYLNGDEVLKLLEFGNDQRPEPE